MKQIKCIFCQIGLVKTQEAYRKLSENDYSFCILSLNPETKGHSLVIPKQHISKLSELDSLDLFDQAIKLGALLMKIFGASAYTLKINNQLYQLDGNKSGHLEHIHIHVIPKYVKDPAKMPKAATKQELSDLRKQFIENG